MNLYQQWCLRKAAIKRRRLMPHYQPGEQVLEIGAGNGALTRLLKAEGLNISAIDVKNKSAFSEIQPLIYDGRKLPFADQQFDTAQMITMLHHCEVPEAIILEAKRVAKRLIIMEDLYSNNIQKKLTFWADSLNNWEFRGHPHSNKNDKEWKQCFKELNLNLEHEEHYPFLAIFQQATYILRVIE